MAAVVNAKTHVVGILAASFIIIIICPDWHLYSLLSISVALYLLALGKSHTLDRENKDMSKNLNPQGLNVRHL
jgi:hypothetical protein